MSGAVAALVLFNLALLPPIAAKAAAASVTSAAVRVLVSGREVRFESAGLANGQLVVRADDAGLAALLAATGARMAWQPGTRFIALTRADAKLVTFTVGGDVMSVDGRATTIGLGPFYYTNQLYVPLLAVAQALGLRDHQFPGGHAFVPQIVSVQRRAGQRRTVIQIDGSAPLQWRAAIAGDAHRRTLSIVFPGFSSVATRTVALGGRDATTASVRESGPPGYPTTSVSIDVKVGVKFASHRLPQGTSVDLVLAKDERDLKLDAYATSQSLRVVAPPPAAEAQASATPTRTPAPSPSPTAAPSVTMPAGVPTAEPLPETTDNAPSSGPSGAPGASAPPAGAPSQFGPAVQKISDVMVNDIPDGSRITLTLTGPVTFEWHRLGDPDNRIWIDISAAVLIGPARDLKVNVPSVRSVRVSQHLISPNYVVRVSIDPSQATDVRIGGVEGSPNQLGIEINNRPPDVDAPTSGVGALSGIQQTPHTTPPVARAPTQQNLIVIDPGHGGNDPGSLNRQVGLVESHITLGISQRLRSDLKRDGWRIALTREGDYEVGDPNGNDRQELQSRCDIANAAGARFFISVHVNSSVSASPNGVSTYYWRGADKALAQAVQNGVLSMGMLANAGVLRGNFYVIRHPLMPAVLVEVAYLSNSHDAALLGQSSFLDRLADAIARGVRDYAGMPPAP